MSNTIKHNQPTAGAVYALAAALAEANERIRVLRDALKHIERVMGPAIPPCCDGCNAEWDEALKTTRAALAAGDKA